MKKGPQCWLWTASRSGGRTGGTYGQFTAASGKGRRSVNAHVFSYELTHGAVPKGAEVMHLCHTPLCVRPDHLKLGTTLENVRMSAEAGHYDVAHPAQHVVTAEQIAYIRAQLASGPRGTAKRLAEEFGVTKGFISQIKHGTRRLHDAPLHPQLEQVG